MKVINLTPHAVTILGSEGELIMEVQSSGNARAKQESSPIGLLDNIPLFETHYGAPIDLPDPANPSNILGCRGLAPYNI